VKTAQDQATPLCIVETIVAVNDAKRAMARKVKETFDLRGKTVAMVAPAMSLITALQHFGANVRAYDQAGVESGRESLSGVTFRQGAYHYAIGASAVVIVAEWEEFSPLDLDRFKSVMAPRDMFIE
jgi:UDPglucose 6-dehydrogenase